MKRTEPPHLRAVIAPLGGARPTSDTRAEFESADADAEDSPHPAIEHTPRGRRRRRPPLIPAPRGQWLSSGLRLAVLALVAAAAAFLTAPRLVRGDLPVDEALVGTAARSVVKADRDYAIVDPDATEGQRAFAAGQSRSVWDLDLSRARADARALQKGLVRLAVALEPVRAALPPPEGRRLGAAWEKAQKAAEPVRATLAGELSLLGVDAPQDPVWRALVLAILHQPRVIDVLLGAVTEALSEPVVGDRALLARDDARGVVLRRVGSERASEQVLDDVGSVEDLRGARIALRERLGVELTRELSLPDEHASAADVASIAGFASSFVRTTLTYAAAESDLRRRTSAADVPPSLIRAHRGETVLRQGEIITERHLLLIRAMAVQQGDELRSRAAFGTAAFVGLLCLVVYLFGARRVFHRSLRPKDLVFTGALLLLVLVGILAADALAPWVVTRWPRVPSQAVFLAVPVALSAMMVRLTLPPEVALLFAMVAALLGGVVLESGMVWAVVAALSSIAGAGVVTASPKPRRLLVAGLTAGLAGAFAVLSLETFRGALVGGELFAMVVAAFGGGVLSGVLLLFITPLVDGLFGYVTDARLYRIADLHQPLLKDLIVHAPGTWHHSMRTAVLAEAAARAVGANPLLARVMALYHDVGKIKQPGMFLENARFGADDRTGRGHDAAHEKLTPQVSAAILRAHVDEGLALARKHGLPRVVADVIAEHHVDNVMESFLERARVQAEADDSVVDEAAFRYRGPPPRTKESALVMIADQIEAAVRHVQTPTPARLAGLVDAFVDRAVTDDALVECDLSLRELQRARGAFTAALAGLLAKDISA